MLGHSLFVRECDVQRILFPAGWFSPLHRHQGRQVRNRVHPTLLDWDTTTLKTYLMMLSSQIRRLAEERSSNAVVSSAFARRWCGATDAEELTIHLVVR